MVKTLKLIDCIIIWTLKYTFYVKIMMFLMFTLRIFTIIITKHYNIMKQKGMFTLKLNEKINSKLI